MFNRLRKIISVDNPIRLAWHWLKGFLAALRYGFPGKKLVVIGVTGTNGKTTTTHLTEHLLRKAGKSVAMISTVELKINGKSKANKSKKTTLSPFLTQKFLRQCVDKNVDYVVIESSSHALHQYRLWGIPFSISVLTNITHEHLDYHQTIEKYRDAKKILFLNTSKNCKRKKSEEQKAVPHKLTLVLNTADQFFEEFNEILCHHKITYGLANGSLRAKDINLSKEASSFILHHKDREVSVNLPLPGSFNVENALAAAGAALSCEISLEEIKLGLDTFGGVPGRMERILSPRGFEVLVDFALTPDALEKLYKTLRQTKPNRIIGIIGSCGDRDKEKRPVMGKIVADLTDLTIVTDEEPYTESPMAIMEDILQGALDSNKQMEQDLLLIEDRYEAIAYAVQNALPGDIVVVTGMGCFETRTLNTGPMPWDEREVVREIIAKYS